MSPNHTLTHPRYLILRNAPFATRPPHPLIHRTCTPCPRRRQSASPTSTRLLAQYPSPLRTKLSHQPGTAILHATPSSAPRYSNLVASSTGAGDKCTITARQSLASPAAPFPVEFGMGRIGKHIERAGRRVWSHLGGWINGSWWPWDRLTSYRDPDRCGRGGSIVGQLTGTLFILPAF